MENVDPVTELQRCFALVRPVGMSDGAVKEWLAAAVAEVRDFAHYRPAQFEAACASVRTSASHHGQIVPGILAKQFYEWEVMNGDARRGLAFICGKQTGAPMIAARGGPAKRIGHLKLVEQNDASDPNAAA